ncbi:MAG TPA: hypothetical protein VIM58_09445, partial [Candidatus Methylacidiphilales bacterium]
MAWPFRPSKSVGSNAQKKTESRFSRIRRSVSARLAGSSGWPVFSPPVARGGEMVRREAGEEAAGAPPDGIGTGVVAPVAAVEPSRVHHHLGIGDPLDEPGRVVAPPQLAGPFRSGEARRVAVDRGGELAGADAADRRIEHVQGAVEEAAGRRDLPVVIIAEAVEVPFQEKVRRLVLRAGRSRHPPGNGTGGDALRSVGGAPLGGLVESPIAIFPAPVRGVGIAQFAVAASAEADGGEVIPQGGKEMFQIGGVAFAHRLPE